MSDRDVGEQRGALRVGARGSPAGVITQEQDYQIDLASALGVIPQASQRKVEGSKAKTAERLLYTKESPAPCRGSEAFMKITAL